MGRYLDLVAQVGGAIEPQSADRSEEEAPDMSHDVTLAAEPHAPAEVIHVAYQEFSVDWAVADGTYTPQQLKKSKVVVKPGPERRYSLCWPGGAPQPAALDGGR